jgi:hypothetical protein
LKVSFAAAFVVVWVKGAHIPVLEELVAQIQSERYSKVEIT